MSKLILSSCIILNLIVGYAQNAEGGNISTVQKDAKGITNERIKLNIDLDSERKLQTAVDKGHQPWRLEPVDVALAALKANSAADVKYDNCSIIAVTAIDAIVECKTVSQHFAVYLKRLIRKKGIWSAMEIAISEN